MARSDWKPGVAAGLAGLALGAAVACSSSGGDGAAPEATPSPDVQPSPPGAAPIAVGIHHRDFWDQQARLDQLGARAIRLNLRWVDDPESPAWVEYDAVIAANRGKAILVTVGTNNGALESETTPKIPETEADIAKLVDFAAELARRYGDAVRYWQLGNEVLVPDNWPCPVGQEDDPVACRLADYARLLAAFGEAIQEEDPDAVIVAAGFGGSSFADPLDSGTIEDRPRRLYDELSAHAAGILGGIDVHNHHEWNAGFGVGDEILAHRDLWPTRYPSLGALEVVVTENSTWTDDPAGDFFGPQSEGQQAAYLVESIYAALGAGSPFCVFGVLQDGLFGSPPLGECASDEDCLPGFGCAGRTCRESLTRFNLNGLYYDPTKVYSDGTGRSGPKVAARTLRLVAWLLEGALVGDVVRDRTAAAGLWRFDVSAPRPHAVLWWAGLEERVTVMTAAPEGAARVAVLTPDGNSSEEWPVDDPLEGFPRAEIEAEAGQVTVDLDRNRPLLLLPLS